ncbi:hypothetical protein ACGFNP_34940 [Nonomuraea sp. NPDC049269]|uniref:hypothetical protein n=1 Tax=Nonomuraea sp. NPDC049269 TaxID=3364349 RepID=UPI0037156BC2
MTLGITLILAAEAVLITVLDRLNHRSPSNSTVPTGVWFILYELALVVGVLLSPLTRLDVRPAGCRAGPRDER